MPDVSALTSDPAATGGLIGSIVAIVTAVAVYVEKRVKTDRRVDRIERSCVNPELCAEKISTLAKKVDDVQKKADTTAVKVAEMHGDVRVIAAKMDWMNNGKIGPYPMNR